MRRVALLTPTHRADIERFAEGVPGQFGILSWIMPGAKPATPVVPVNGYVAVPTGPGLGIEVNGDVLTRFRADG